MFSVESANNTNLANGALSMCNNLPDENTAMNFSIHSIEDQMLMTTPRTTPGKKQTTSGASQLSAMTYTLAVFTFWFSLHSCAKTLVLESMPYTMLKQHSSSYNQHILLHISGKATFHLKTLFYCLFILGFS